MRLLFCVSLSLPFGYHYRSQCCILCLNNGIVYAKLLSFPIAGKAVAKQAECQTRAAYQTDSRVGFINEFVQGIISLASFPSFYH
jgi:hypothetical protein